MGKRMRYFVVQLMENGEWGNCSTRFFLKGLRGALNCYDLLKRDNPDEKYRIATGFDTLEF